MTASTASKLFQDRVESLIGLANQISDLNQKIEVLNNETIEGMSRKEIKRAIESNIEAVEKLSDKVEKIWKKLSAMQQLVAYEKLDAKGFGWVVDGY